MLKMALSPKESGEFIVKYAKYIKVNEAGIEKLKDVILEGLTNKSISIENFSQSAFHPKNSDSWAVEWIFVVDTLNFCFWTPGSYSKWSVDNNTGYFALCSAINRAMKEGFDIMNPNFYANITLDQLTHILRPDDGITQVPLLKERLAHLHEAGKKLLEKYDGKFENCVKSCNQSAKKLLRLIVEEFPCFKDESEYAGQRVSFYKRAQILIGDLWACFQGKGIGQFSDIDTITMFADYRVPQVLVHFGALEYSKELLEVLKKDTIMTNGNEMEVEIRGASIYIVEELKKKILKDIETKYQGISRDNVNSILLDHFLWDYRRRFAKKLACIPFHKKPLTYLKFCIFLLCKKKFV